MASPQDSPRDNDAPRDDGDDGRDDAPARRSRSRSPDDRRDRSRSRSPRGRSRSRSRSPARGGYGSSPPPRGERKTGVAGRWNPRGFGFITPDDGSEEIFVHQTAIHSEGFRSLREVRGATRHPRVPSVLALAKLRAFARFFFRARADGRARADAALSRGSEARAPA